MSSSLAEERLTPAALATVRDLIGAGASLAEAPTWADSQREVPNSGPWHYVNVLISEPQGIVRMSWEPTEQGIYFIDNGPRPAVIKFNDFATKQANNIVSLHNDPEFSTLPCYSSDFAGWQKAFILRRS